MPGSNGQGLAPALSQEPEDVSGSTGNGIDYIKLLSSGITGGSSIISSIINAFSNSATNRANTEMQEMANQHNIDLWKMQTSYNTPAKQIERLKAAGLNPNLIYGNPTNTAGAPPEMKASRNERYQMDPMMIANAMLLSKQIKQTEADISLKDAEARDLNADAALKEDDLSYRPKLRAIEEESRRIANNYTRKAIDKLDQEIKTEEQVTELKKVSVDRAKEELNEYKELRPLRKQQLEEGIKELISRRGRNDAEKAYLYKMASYVSKQESILDYQEQLYELYLTPQYYDPSANNGKGGYISEAEKRMKAESIMQSLEQELLENQVAIDNATFKDRYENATREAEYQNTWWSIFWDEYVGSITSSVGKIFSTSASVSKSNVPRRVLTKG